MIKYTSTKQLSIEEFRTPFYRGLDKNNRWVKLAQMIPWDDFAKIYAKALCEDFGRPAIDARVVIGAMIIKSKKRLPDEETTEEIKENAYLQYFLGYEEFSHKEPFDPSLFVTLRERLGIEAFEQLNQSFIERVEKVEKENNEKEKPRPEKNVPKDFTDKRQGKLILDASVAPQDIRFPTDLDLLNDTREHTERLIDSLWVPGPGKRKPVTYRKKARQSYLSLARKKKKGVQEIRKALRKQLCFVGRNLRTIRKLIDPQLGQPLPLNHRDLKIFWIVQEIYSQQKKMYDQRTHQVSDRIVNVSQPYVRPIVRGKAGKDVEFGAKISASVVNGYVFLDHLSWDAYNENTHLMDQVEKYKERFGFYPEKVLGDRIYGTGDNRKYLKEKGIEYSGRALGRPPILTKEEAKLARKNTRSDAALRNRIESKFGEGKRRYDLDVVKTKTMKTSESWISAIFFVMNLAAWLRKDLFLPFFKLIEIVKERLLIRPKWVFCS